MRLRLAAAAIVLVLVIAYFAVPTGAPGAATPERAELADIEAGRTTTPIVSGAGVTFYAQGDLASPPRLVSDLTGWGERADGTFDFTVGRMNHITGTRWFTLTARADPGARIEYLFVHGAGDYRTDPNNPRTVSRVGGEASEVVTPGYVPPPEFAAPPTRPAGRVTEAMVKGVIVGQRRVIIYTPPGYDPSHQYRVVIFHDGGLVANTGEAPRVLDWLIAHDAIYPVIAAFVDPVSRTDDYRRGAPLRDFVGGELMPWLASHYSITPVAADHAIVGLSASARGAVDAMAAYPGVFGKIGLMIPALTEDDLTTIPVRRGEDAQLQAVVLAARYDTLNLHGAVAARDAFIARGHAVKYLNVPEGHSTITWKTHLGDVMISLFAR